MRRWFVLGVLAGAWLARKRYPNADNVSDSAYQMIAFQGLELLAVVREAIDLVPDSVADQAASYEAVVNEHVVIVD